MKTILSPFVLAFALFQCAHAQSVRPILSIEPDKAYDNIHLEKVYSDSNCTAFIIWVKQGVRPHYHAHHTESLYVLSGKGIMQMGDKKLEIKAGDYFTIPEKMVHAVEVVGDDPLKVLSIQSPEFLGKDRIFVE